MGYQESWFYMEPQRKFDKLIRAYERAESAGYYRVAGAEPCSVVILKQPFGDVPAGSKVLWVCGDRGFHSVGGVFGDTLHCRARIRVIPVEEVLEPGMFGWRASIWTAPCPRKMTICAGIACRTMPIECGREG